MSDDHMNKIFTKDEITTMYLAVIDRQIAAQQRLELAEDALFGTDETWQIKFIEDEFTENSRIGIDADGFMTHIPGQSTTCECGADASGTSLHSTWCPKQEGR